MRKKNIALLVILIILFGFLIYCYVYKSHRDIASEKGSYLVTATIIHQQFKSDERKANEKYLDKTICVYGKITNIDFSENSIIIDEKMLALFKDKVPKDLQLLSNIEIKGRFIGYDDLLEELKMDQCVIEDE